MASGDTKKSNHVATGTVTGTGSDISVDCGFKPKAVLVANATGEATLYWNDLMADASGYKVNGTSSGTAAAQTFTGTASTAGEISAFTGTGQSSSGQVITTTDNQTMTLNQCAGMWFISATHGPYFIVSNTAVTGAPAVLTVIGDAPTTDAGAYRIVKAPTPVGTNGSSAVTGGSSDTAFISSNGITPTFNGFTLGADTDVNVSAEVTYWTAWK